MPSFTFDAIGGLDLVPVTPGPGDLVAPIAGAKCHGLWIGTAGTINIETEAGNTRNGVPALAGSLPIRCKKVLAGGTAANIWAIY